MTDNQKINDLFSRIKNFDFPDCQSVDFKQLVSEVQEGFQIIQRGIIAASNQIKSNLDAETRASELEYSGVAPMEVAPNVFDIAPEREEVQG